MAVYYGIYGLLAFLACFVRRGLVYWLALAALLLFVGFRFWVGCDFSGYLVNWEIMANAPMGEALLYEEPAHWALIALLSAWGLPYTALNVVAAGIFFAGFHALARRQPNPMAMLALAFPILIVNMPMSAIRQAEAIGFVCFAFNAFIDRSLSRYVFFVALASLFHNSAIVFLGFAPLVHLRFNTSNVAIGALLALPGLYLMVQGTAAEIALSRYVGTGVEAFGALFRLLVLVLSGFFYLWKIAPLWQRQSPHDYKLVTMGAWLMTGFFTLFFVSSVIGDRFGYYLIPIQLMIFARLPHLQGLRNRQLWSIAPWVMLTLVFVVWTQISWHFQECYLPYQFGIHPG